MKPEFVLNSRVFEASMSPIGQHTLLNSSNHNGHFQSKLAEIEKKPENIGGKRSWFYYVASWNYSMHHPIYENSQKSIGIGIGIEILLGIDLGIGIEKLASSIGIGIENLWTWSIGIGIGIEKLRSKVLVLVLVLKKYSLEVLVLVLVLMDRSGIGIGIGIDPKFRYCTSLVLMSGENFVLFSTKKMKKMIYLWQR